MAAIRQRGIKYVAAAAGAEGAHADRQPELDGDELVWPLVIACDEHAVMEVADAVGEHATVQDVLQHMYEQPPQWGAHYRFSPLIEVYYASSAGTWVRVSVTDELGAVLARPDFVVRGVPVLHIVNSARPHKKTFLASPPSVQ